MRLSQRLLILLGVLFFAIPPVLAETIFLKGDRRVVGEVLKSDDDIVIVDLGCAVLRLPRSEIVSIEKPEEKPPPGGALTGRCYPADRQGRSRLAVVSYCQA